MHITPTVGRVVWFHSRKVNNTEPLPALICKVIDGNHVNLAAFTEDGKPFGDGFQNVPSIELLDDQRIAEPGDKDFWSWMPFQKGQAAKTNEVSETFEKRLAEIEAKMAEHLLGKPGEASPVQPPPVQPPPVQPPPVQPPPVQPPPVQPPEVQEEAKEAESKPESGTQNNKHSHHARKPK